MSGKVSYSITSSLFNSLVRLMLGLSMLIEVDPRLIYVNQYFSKILIRQGMCFLSLGKELMKLINIKFKVDSC